jgi:fatty-acyl-CoA synthase
MVTGTAPEHRHVFTGDIEARLRRDHDVAVLVDDLRSYRGQEFADLISRLKQALRDRGISTGSRVALVAPASGPAIAVRYAAAGLGATTVFCPDAGSPERLAVFLSRIAADVVIVFPETAASVSGIAVPQLLSVGPVTGAKNLLDDAEVAGPVSDEALTISPDDECALIATGGTTGVSKASVRTFAEYRRLIDLGPMPGRRQLVCTPLAYIAQTLVDSVLLGGGIVFLHNMFTAKSVLKLIAREGITHLALVEPLLVELVDSEHLPSADLSSIVGISHVGADAAPSLRRRLLDRVGRPILVNPYGASEFGVVSMLAGPDYTGDSPHLPTSGRVLPSVQVQIVREDGSLCDTDEPGLVCVRTPAQAHGYSIAPPTSGFVADRWFRTGDIGVLDAQGYLRIRGRAGDHRIVGGTSVFPVDLQQALCAHPEVRYAVAVTAPEGRRAPFGVVVTLAPGATVDVAELKHSLSLVNAALAGCPVNIVDTIATTEQGKPNRIAITALLYPRS